MKPERFFIIKTNQFLFCTKIIYLYFDSNSQHIRNILQNSRVHRLTAGGSLPVVTAGP